MTKKKKKNTKKNKIQISPLYLFLLIIFAIVTIASPASLLVLFIGLMPSFVAFFVDNTPKKSTAISVLAFNITFCIPFLTDLWQQGFKIGGFNAGLDIISDPVSIIVMYMGATVGYGLHWLTTSVMENFLKSKMELRRKSIVKKQQALVKLWGPEVKSDYDASKESDEAAQDNTEQQEA